MNVTSRLMTPPCYEVGVVMVQVSISDGRTMNVRSTPVRNLRFIRVLVRVSPPCDVALVVCRAMVVVVMQ